MAIMESTSSNMSSSSQAAPNTPGAPPTPQQDQPATPIHQYNMPGTPGQSTNIGTPNASHGKMVSMYSPHPGKGATQQPINQQGATSMGNINQYSGGVQQVNTSQQPSLQHGQIMSPQGQSSIRPSNAAPTRAIIAAKQAEQLAKAQASTGVRPNLPAGVVRHVKQNPMRPQLTISGGMQQVPWTNPGGGGHPGNTNIGMRPTAASNAAMQGSNANMGQQKSDRWTDMITKNPQLAAHVIKQTRQQHQRPQQVFIFSYFARM